MEESEVLPSKQAPVMLVCTLAGVSVWHIHILGYPQPGTKGGEVVGGPKKIEAREVVWKYQSPMCIFRICIYIYKQICRYMKIFEKGGLGIWTFYDIFGTSRNSIRE